MRPAADIIMDAMRREEERTQRRPQELHISPRLFARFLREVDPTTVHQVAHANGECRISGARVIPMTRAEHNRRVAPPTEAARLTADGRLYFNAADIDRDFRVETGAQRYEVAHDFNQRPEITEEMARLMGRAGVAWSLNQRPDTLSWVVRFSGPDQEAVELVAREVTQRLHWWTAGEYRAPFFAQTAREIDNNIINHLEGEPGRLAGQTATGVFYDEAANWPDGEGEVRADVGDRGLQAREPGDGALAGAANPGRVDPRIIERAVEHIAALD